MKNAFKKASSKSLFLFLCFPLLWACRTGEPEPEKDYTLIEKNGIFREQFDSTNVADSRYTDNNLVFRSGSTFLYDFKHISGEGEEFYFMFVPTRENPINSWLFVPADSISENTIQQVKITVKPGLEPMINNSPDYDQTVIQFEYPVENGKSSFASHSGVIENEKNIWIH